MLPVMYTAPSKKESIKKIIMDIDSSNDTLVVPTIIEKETVEEACSVRIFFNAFSSSSLRFTVIGTLPINSGIKPNFIRFILMR